jgi:RNA-directed DNA polymerase
MAVLGLYTHACKMETLERAYRDAKQNSGAPGIDGVTFDDIEKAGLTSFIEQIQIELVSETYRPMRNRRKEIPKGPDQVRGLGIPALEDKIVQKAATMILTRRATPGSKLWRLPQKCLPKHRL